MPDPAAIRRRDYVAERIKASLARKRGAEGRQKNLVENSGLSQNRISKIMNEKADATGDELKIIAEALGEPPNYFTEGMPHSTPPVALLGKGASLPTLSCLLRRLAPPIALFEDAGFFEFDPTRLCVGQMISISPLGAVGPELVSIKSVSDALLFPTYATEAMRAALQGLIEKGERDGDKVAVLDWERATLDAKKGQISVVVAHSKYHMNRAIRNCRDKIWSDLSEGRLHLFGEALPDGRPLIPELPVNLNCDAILISADRHLIIAQRGQGTDADQFGWGASCGEGIDWYQDRGTDGELSVLKTMQRGLIEEYGLPDSALACASVTFLEYAFSLANFLKLMIALVEFSRLSSAEILEYGRRNRKDAELRAFESMPFRPEQCAAAVASGLCKQRRLTDAGRFCIAIAASHVFGEQFTAALSGMPTEGRVLLK